VAGAPTLSDALRAVAAECGVDYDHGRARVLDHIAYDASEASGGHTRVIATHAYPLKALTGAPGGPGILYEGLGMAISPDNILAVAALTGSDTTYSATPGDAIRDYPQSAGKETVLVAAVQARNNARATFTGSLWMLSDAAFTAPITHATLGAAKAGNAAFAAAVSAWTFQEAGVLRASNVRHHRADGSSPDHQITHVQKRDLPRSMFPEPEVAGASLVYRIKDDIVYAVDLHEYNGSAWVPYTGKDVQLEFVMLDAYIRQNLVTDGSGTYTAAFTAPDVYGIYHFRVMYRRPGLSVVHLVDQVSVRPFRHDEYERFILSAYPYYASAFSMMAGVLVFASLYLYAK
jgi:oligosaccharyltransferase complex subunit beta